MISCRQYIAYIGLGSNIEPDSNLPRAIRNLSAHTELLALSSIWKSSPVPAGIDGPDFLNAVVKISTSHTLEILKRDILLTIERDFGRVRSANKFAPRSIDLDILIFNEQELEPNIWHYAYIAVPLAEIYPDFIHMPTKQKLRQTADALRAKQSIKKQNLSWGISYKNTGVKKDV